LENTLLTLPPVGGLPLIKLTDFGFCKNLMNSLARSQVGTPAYIGVTPLRCIPLTIHVSVKEGIGNLVVAPKKRVKWGSWVPSKRDYQVFPKRPEPVALPSVWQRRTWEMITRIEHKPCT
jgi:hypothetical protein